MLTPLDLMRVGPVIPVIVIEDVATAVPLARALVAGGVRVLEVTLRTAVGLDAIRAIASEVSDAIVGVGTISHPADFERSITAGACFGVSPGLTPALIEADPRLEASDPRYADLDQGAFPRTECLKDTVARFLPFWHATIAPAVRSGKQVIIAAHGNSLRALVKYFDNVSDTDIVELNIPTGQPLVYELDNDLKPIKHYYLGDEEAIKASMQAVANQGKAVR